MLQRYLTATLQQSLSYFPVVALVGPRQAGKTTLSRMLADASAHLFLDLESRADMAKLADPEFFLGRHQDQLVIIDEVQRMPELFPALRVLVDRKRRPGRFLLLGSASPNLKRQAAESLAGRIIYHELHPFHTDEVGSEHWEQLWLRGGFPPSYLAPDDRLSQRWRQAFITTHLERDLPQLGINLPASTMERFWRMIAHFHGQLWNASKIAASMGLTGPTTSRYLDILCDTYMLRQLQPFHFNTKKRLVKSPKVYVRDSGLLHTLLGPNDMDNLLAHPEAGSSWEGFCLQQILARLPDDWRASFYRSHAGAEIDLILEDPSQRRRIGCEFKLASDPRITSGCRNAAAELDLAHLYIIHPGGDSWPMAPRISACSLRAIPRDLNDWG